MKHDWYECPKDAHPNNEPCMFCDGGLGLCTVCGGAEGSLTTECMGGPVDYFTLQKVYQTNLDFINGGWVRSQALTHLMKGESALFHHLVQRVLQCSPSMVRNRIERGW
jgi:hypothetical protein